MSLMAKKKPKLTLYVDLEPMTKRRLDRLATARRRKLTAEVQIALDRYLDEEEKKEKNLPPLDADEDE